MILHLDFETHSAVDLGDVGIDNYAKHPTTAVLMLGYAFGNSAVRLWEPHLGPLPEDLVLALHNPEIIKAAWNAGFERNILCRKLGIWIPYELWIDPMINARYISLPGGLDSVGEILDLPPNLRKDKEGERLTHLFGNPLPVKKRRNQATNENTLFDISPIEPAKPEYVFADHISHPEDWQKLGDYCKQDIVAERALGERLDHFPLPEVEKKLWYLDQKINMRGMPADRKFVTCSLSLASADKDRLRDKQKQLTGLENPNSNAQMLKWAHDQGYPYNSLRKEPVSIALNDPQVKLTPVGREVLTIRKQSSKTSYTKLAAILDALSDDDYLRDQFLFLGSARAGRWSGKQVQMHNMARPIKTLEAEGALDKARALIYAMDFEGIEREFTDPKTKTKGSVIDIVTSCIRSAFVAPEGYRFNVCDLNAIENRVLGWVAGEDKILDVFRQKRCPYLSFASLMYNVPYDVLAAAYKKKDPDAKEKRQVAKPAVLGAGYRLSGGEWGTNRYGDRIKTGLWGYAENMGVVISQDLAHRSVKSFREEYQRVVRAWYQYEEAVIRCLKGAGPQALCETGPKDSQWGCEYQGAKDALIWCQRRERKNGEYVLIIHLPSGRCLHYVNAQVIEKEFPGRDGQPYKKQTMTYEGINQENKQWEMIYTHGGKLIENVVQAISRDILANAMLLADDLGFEIVGHVHDEIITMSRDVEDSLGLLDLQWCMSQTPEWAPGLPLHAEGYEDSYYHK